MFIFFVAVSTAAVLLWPWHVRNLACLPVHLPVWPDFGPGMAG